MISHPSTSPRSGLWVIGTSVALVAGLSAQQSTQKAQVDLVSNDVVVRDSKGQFVPDLWKDEFELYEDGVKQQIVSANVVTGGRIFLFFVDDLHLEFVSTGRIRGLFTTIEQRLLRDGDMFGIVSSGPSSIHVDLTFDRSQLDNAIRAIAGNALKPADIVHDTSGAHDSSEIRYREHVAMSAAGHLLTALEAVHNRRKSVVYVIDGYGFNPLEDARPGITAGDLRRELWDLTHAANRANTTFYTFAARGLVAGSDPGPNVDQTQWSQYLRNTVDTLRVLAEETGGIAIGNQDDVDQGLKRIDAESGDYYVLAYTSSNPDRSRRSRRIDVRVTRKGIPTVVFRKEYTP